MHARFAAQIEAAHAETGLPELPHEAFAAAVGAVNELVAERVRQGRIETLPELAGTVRAIQVRLLAGPGRLRVGIRVAAKGNTPLTSGQCTGRS